MEAGRGEAGRGVDIRDSGAQTAAVSVRTPPPRRRALPDRRGGRGLAALRGPRGLVVGAAVVVLVGLLALAGVQVRAAQAQEARDRAAQEQAQQQAEQQRALDEAERQAAEEADRRSAAAAERRLARAAATATADAALELERGTTLLEASAGAVDDDAVRVALAGALDGLRALLDAAGQGEPDRAAVDALTAGTVVVRTAAATVTDAQGVWAAARAEAERVAAEAAQVRAAEEEAAQRAAGERAAGERADDDGAAAGGDPGAGPRPPSAGAAPDCGSPQIREAPSGPVGFATSTPSESGDGSNGRMPRSRMAALPWCVDGFGYAQWLRADAAAAMVRLNEEFRARFGENIAIDLAYRSYEQQVAMRQYYGSLAARPGTSNHGWGTAVDTWEWAAYAFGSERYEWLVTHGPAHGWVAPGWARQDGSNPEYWHFEYTG